MYKIVGADKREYGPVTKETVLEWIAQGRANAQTIARFEDGAWKPLSTFDEFKALLNIPPTPAAATASATTAPPIAPVVMQTGRETNNMAIAALVFSILGFVCCPCLGAGLGVILGFISLGEIKQNPHRYSTDKSVPIVAIVLGIIGLLTLCGVSIFSDILKRFLEGLKFG
jgi:hypothetical protein